MVGTKEDLLGAVADQVADELIAAVDERFSQPGEADQPLDDLVRDDMRWFVDTIAGNPTIASVVRLAGRFALHPDDPAAGPGAGSRTASPSCTPTGPAASASSGRRRPGSCRSWCSACSRASRCAVSDEPWPLDAVADLVAEFALGGYLRTELEGASDAFEDRV